MTNEEAKALFEEDLKDGKCSDDCPECNARELAIKALEKQIPKKPAEHGDEINYDCPVCGADVGYFDAMAWETPKYCPECGQALDWDRKEEEG